MTEIEEDTKKKLEQKIDEITDKYNIKTEFPEECIEEMKKIENEFKNDIKKEKQKKERRNLIDITTFTVDPKRAQDFDDAISLQIKENSWTLWVHIADVSYYVSSDTNLYKEAKQRATSVYFPGHTIHMLPTTISETVCSLVPKENRLAHTVKMEVNKDLSFDSIEIFKSIIQSNHRLTYSEAESIIEDDKKENLDKIDTKIIEKIEEAYNLAKKMRETRIEDGSLVLNPERKKAHTLVEECMLKANKAVTHELMWNRGVEAMYRVHPQPTDEQWSEALQEINEIEGISIPASEWNEPRKAVNNAINNANEEKLRKIQRSVLKVMPRARYMNDPFGGHYALNFEIYGHFTSPIRRIADLINHKIVHENKVPEDLLELADKATEKQLNSERAEREYKKYLEELGLDTHEVEEYKIDE